MLTELKRQLDSQCELATLLQDNINALSDLLGSDTLDGLDSLLSANDALLQRLSEADRQCRELLKANGYAPDKLATAVADFPNDVELQATWQKFTTLIRDCQSKNTASGTLVRGQLRHTEQILSLLTGADINTGNNYSPSGKTNPSIPSRPIAKA